MRALKMRYLVPLLALALLPTGTAFASICQGRVAWTNDVQSKPWLWPQDASCCIEDNGECTRLEEDHPGHIRPVILAEYCWVNTIPESL